MAIQLSIDGLPALYQFKRDTIALCIEYAREVLASSHKTKIRRVDDRLAEIKTELYDIFCRWNFVALARGGFDLVTCLPSDDSFVILTDLYYYLRRFGVEAGDSIVEFPHEAFRAILETAKAGGGNGVVPRSMYPSEEQRRRLESIYLGSAYPDDVRRILCRYQYLGGLNNSLSVPPSVLDVFPSHELFGTPLNTHTSFCSPFSDERVFSSCGSFFEFTDFGEKVYFANPPFDDSFCDDVADRLLERLDVRPFRLVVVIPVWDTEEQQKRGLKDLKMPFSCYRKLKASRHFRTEHFLDKDKFPFYNYFTQRLVYVCHVHLMSLGEEVDTDRLVAAWAAVSKK